MPDAYPRCTAERRDGTACGSTVASLHGEPLERCGGCTRKAALAVIEEELVKRINLDVELGDSIAALETDELIGLLLRLQRSGNVLEIAAAIVS